MTPANDDGFRPGQDFAAPKRPAPAAPEAPAVLAFTEAADAGGTDLDVLMGYQLLLGRDPENSAVIADAKNSPVRAFIKALLISDEFQSGVAAKLEAGAALPHELGSNAPSERQRDWLLRHLSVPLYAETMLRSAPSWRDFTRVLLRVPGMPRTNAAAPAAPAAGTQARHADEGFVLIHLEQPKPGKPILPGARVAGSGWTIAPADIAEVAILLDETVLTHARYGLARSDVTLAFPHYRHVDHCGFDFLAVIPPDYPVTFASRLVVRVRTVRGDEGEKGVRLLPPLASGTMPTTSNAGAVDASPMRLAIDEAVIDASRVLRLRGWAAARAGIADVRVSLGETELAQAVTGLARADIAKANPDFPEAGQSGFALVHGLPASLAEGPGFVRVQATDRRGQTRQMTAPVIVPPAPAGGAVADRNPDLAQSTGIACSCDVAGLCVDGRFAAIGWALADKGITAIEVELDGLSAGRAQLAVPRLDVAAQHPQHAHAGTAGFTFVADSPRRLAPGPHILTLRLKSRGGGTRVLELPLEAVPLAELPPAAHALLEPPVDRVAPPAPRPPAVELRLEMDRPALDGTEAREALQGALSISGWAVARTGIEGVSVFLDDTLLGAAHIGMRREDIGAAYPDLPGSLLAGYALVLPPGALAEGRHEIKVVATAKVMGAGPAARAEKRFFLKVEPFHAVPPGGTPRDRIPAAEQALGAALLAQASARAHFQLLVVADEAAALPSLARTLASLSAQAYADWSAQIILPERARAAALKLPQAADPAGRIAFAADPDMPTGKPRFLAKLRAGDVLGADALLAMALALAADPGADLLYSDELRFDPAQQRVQPFFKPDFSPELLLSMNYPGRLCCASQALVQAAGFTPAGFGAAGDYDAVLRLSEHARNIVHLPRVLCTRGNGLDSPAAEQAALAAALKRRKRRGIVEPGTIKGTWQIRRADPAAAPRGARRDGTLVSIIMPTCSARGLVRRAIAAIRATTAPARAGGPAVEIVVLDNTPASDRASRAWLRRNADTVIDMPGPFNWSRFNNAGAAAARGSYLLFLNDDIEMPQADWLDRLLEQASRPAVGVVGARLLYPGGTVQHAGQYLADGHARHAFRFADPQNPGPFGLATVTREMIAVTGACQLMRRAVFDRLGGYEEAHSIVNNDLDFCLRSWQAGLAVIYTPQASLVHHELASRARLEDAYDAERFAGAWRQLFLQGDPYRNPHLGADSDHYGPEPEPAVWLHAGRRGVPADTVRRILVVKLDHIGDFLTAHPALAALAAGFPQAAIDLLVPSATAALARQGGMLPAGVHICEIEIFDFFHARSGEGRKEVGEAELAALEARLAPRAYDLAIDLRMHPETRTVLRHTGARLCAGFDIENRFPWLDVALAWEGDVRLVRKRAHVSERLVQLVAATQAACATERPAHRSGAAKPPPSKAFDALPAPFRARPIVCIHPGVGNVVRQWPAASFAALIDLLAARPGLNAVLIGSPDEAAIADEIKQKVADPSSVVSLVGQVKLAELPLLMQRCILFVGNNSGPQHIAATLGMKTLGIHSGVVDAAEWAPRGTQAMAIRRRMVCSPCYLEFASDCPRDLACLAGLLPREVHAACLHLLGGNAFSQKSKK
jgi:ADP-heptose:LPS heptosyltransferase/GT2 family glycosyltransferase